MSNSDQNNFLKKKFHDLMSMDETFIDFIQENMFDGIWYWGIDCPEDKIISTRFWEKIGYNSEVQTFQEDWQNYIYPEDLNLFNTLFGDDINDSNYMYNQEIRFIHKNDTIVKFRCFGKTIHDNGEEPKYMCLVFKEITVDGSYDQIIEYKQNASEAIEELSLQREEFEAVNEELRQTNEELYKAKELIEESERRWKFALEGARDGVWDWNIETSEVFFSPQWKAMLGFSEEEIANELEEWDKRVHPDDKEQVYKDINAHMNRETSVYENKHRLLCKNGTYKWILDRGKVIERDEKGNALRMIGTHTDISELMSVEMELAASQREIEEKEKRYRSLFSSMQEGVYLHELIYDGGVPVDYRIIDANPISEEILGIKQQDAINKTAKELYQVEVAPFLDTYSKVAETGEPYSFEQYFPPLQKWFHISVYSPCKGQFATAFLDITESKLNEEKHRYLFENMSQGVVYHNKVGHVIYANKAAADILGLTIDQLTGKTSMDPRWKSIREDGSDYPGELHPAQRTLKSGKKIENEIMGVFVPEINDYRWININSTPKFRLHEETPYEVLVTFEDITAIRKAKEIAEKNEQFNKLLFEILPVGLALTKKTGEIVYANKAYIDIIGYTMEETMKLTYWDITPQKYAKQEEEQLLSLNKTGYYGPYEKEYRHKSGQLIPVRLIGRYIEVEDEEFIWSSVEDISEKKRYEQQIIEAKQKAEESDRLKTEFINNMSHEIRTPMNGIMGFASFLNDPELSEAKRSHYINIINNSSEQLLHIIDDILEISRLETKQVKVEQNEICLNEMLFELFSVFDLKAKDSQIPLYLKKGLSDKQSTIITDRTKLNKIISNLLENALKYTNEGYVEFGYHLRHKKNEPCIEMYVRDTGIGIRPEKQQIIFDRFSQEDRGLDRSVGGLGLGLSIAKENTELLSGQLFVESEKGVGSTFFVCIPYVPKHPESAELAWEESPSTRASQNTILIAEDEEINFLYLEALLDKLEGYDFSIIHAKNGDEALNLCQNNPNINMVLMDIKMPGLNGNEVTKIIKNHRADLPIIAQSAYSTASDIKEAKSLGYDDYLVKPIDEKIFLDTVIKYLV